MSTKYPTRNSEQVNAAYKLAQDQYAALGVDTDAVIKMAQAIPVSMHCWQGDDVVGFEVADRTGGGGIFTTGNHPGRARNADELRADIELALKLMPGAFRLNLHAIYAETDGQKVSRDQLEVKYFARWQEWSRQHKIPLDFNPTCFGHPMASSGFTLSHPDSNIRQYWIDHVSCCRRIAAAFGASQGTASVCNIWVPDGSKDMPADRFTYRNHLVTSLDKILQESFAPTQITDAVEGKLFGIGSESFVVGSNDFYLAYALTRKVFVTLDAGHFHPTETIDDKISTVLNFAPGLLLHVSRGVRWDSDHVVNLDDPTIQLFREIAHGKAFGKVRIATDYFDASINRIVAWVVGLNCVRKAILIALLEPWELAQKAEAEFDFSKRLAWQQEFLSLPFGAVWDKLCLEADRPIGASWLAEVDSYQEAVLSKR